MYTADLQTSRLFFLNSIKMFLAANVWCGTMSPYPPAPSPSIRDDSQQQAEDTGHVYKEMERKWYVCNNPKCRKTFTKFAYEADLEPTGGTKGKRNTPRWKATARFAIYVGLKKKGLISAVSKNQWVITAKGRELISKKM